MSKGIAVSVYLFTFHAYRSWMPDHPRGYTRRGEGYLAPDEEAARQYAENATGEAVLFDAPLQRLLIEEAQVACGFQQLRLHGASTEPTHAHLLVSWKTGKDWMRVRTGLKTSLSLRLQRESERRDLESRESNPREEPGRWELRLSRGASRKQVKDRRHFDHLMRKYLPDHGGVKWFEDRGWIE